MKSYRFLIYCMLFFTIASCGSDVLDEKSSEDFPERSPSMAEELILELGDNLIGKLSSIKIVEVQNAGRDQIESDQLVESENINQVLPSLLKGAISTFTLSSDSSPDIELLIESICSLSTNYGSDSSSAYRTISTLFKNQTTRNQSSKIERDNSLLFGRLTSVVFDYLGSQLDSSSDYLVYEEKYTADLMSQANNLIQNDSTLSNVEKDLELENVAKEVATKATDSVYQHFTDDFECNSFIDRLKQAIVDNINPTDTEKKDEITRQIINSVDKNVSTHTGKPVAQSQELSTPEDSELVLTLSGVDANYNDFDFNVQSNPLHGALTLDLPNITYKPNEDFNGEDRFDFVVFNMDKTSDIATVKISVSAVYDAPEIGGTPATEVNTGHIYTFQPEVLNPDGLTLQFSIENKPDWLSFDPATGRLAGSPDNPDVADVYQDYENIIITLSDSSTDSALPAFNLRVFDVSGPKILSIDPSSDDTGISTLSRLILQFDEPIDFSTIIADSDCSGSVNLCAQNSTNTCLDLDSTIDNQSPHKLILAPSIELQTNTTYVIDLNSSVADLAGNNLDTYSSQFKTHVNWPGIVTHGAYSEIDQMFVRGNTIALDSYGNVIVAGYVNLYDTYAFLRQYNGAGGLKNEKFLTEAWSDGSDLVLDDEDSLYLVGHTNAAFAGYVNQGAYDIFLAKFDDFGDADFITQFGSPGYEYANAVIIDASDNVLIVGVTTSEFVQGSHQGQKDYFVMKFDASGNEIWRRQYGTLNKEEAFGIDLDSDNNIYLTGYTAGNLNGQSHPNLGTEDVFVSKLDTNGNHLWTSIFGSNEDDSGIDLVVLPTGEIIVAGHTSGNIVGGNKGGRDVIFAKLDSSGNVTNKKQYGSSSTDELTEITISSTGDIFAVGNSLGNFENEINSSENHKDVLLMRLDASLDIKFNRLFGGEEDDSGHGISIDRFNNVYITGYTSKLKEGSDWNYRDYSILLKVRPDGTLLETITPEITSLDLRQNDLGTFVKSKVGFSFSEAINTNTITVNSSDDQCTGSVAISTDFEFGTCIRLESQITFSDDNSSFFVTPQQSLEFNTDYYVKLTSGIMDIANNPLEPYSSQFTTISHETTAPNIIGITPTDNSTDVSVSSHVYIKFNESIDPDSVTTNVETTSCSGSIQVSTDGFGSCIKMVFEPVSSNSDKLFAIIPENDLSTDTFYTINLTDTIIDWSGNSLSASSSSFQTDSTMDWRYDFESGAIDNDISFSGSANWKIVESDTGENGSYSFSSGSIYHVQNSCFSITRTLNQGNYSFKWRVSSELNSDYLYFYINDQVIERWSGIVSQLSLYSGQISSPGEPHTFRWCYEKNDEDIFGQDRAIIDDIVLK